MASVRRELRTAMVVSGAFGTALGFLLFGLLSAVTSNWIVLAGGFVFAVGLACLLPVLITTPVWFHDGAKTARRPPPLESERLRLAKASTDSVEGGSPNAASVSADAPNSDSALALVRERYARGELSMQEYETALETLLETGTVEDVRDRVAQEGTDGRQ